MTYSELEEFPLYPIQSYRISESGDPEQLIHWIEEEKYNEIEKYRAGLDKGSYSYSVVSRGLEIEVKATFEQPTGLAALKDKWAKEKMKRR